MPYACIGFNRYKRYMYTVLHCTQDVLNVGIDLNWHSKLSTKKP